MYDTEHVHLTECLKVLFGGHVKNMFIKVVNNWGVGWVITEEDDDGFSAEGNDFMQYFTGVLHN